MQIHFSEDLEFNDSKKEVISRLVCQRINLLLGVRKASCVENVFFCDAFPKDVLSLRNSNCNYNLCRHIGLFKDCGKVNLYCTSHMLYTLIRQTAEVPSFDDAIMAIACELINL